METLARASGNYCAISGNYCAIFGLIAVNLSYSNSIIQPTERTITIRTITMRDTIPRNNWNNRWKPSNNRNSDQFTRKGYNDGQKYNRVPYDYDEENNEHLIRSFVQYLKNNS